jgi:hypothetical protein
MRRFPALLPFLLLPLVVLPLPTGMPPDACALLTAEEIAAAAGWKPASTKHEHDGTTETCRIAGPSETQMVVIVLAKPAPQVSTSGAMAEWRRARAARLKLKVTVTPLEGLGAPAIRTDEETSPPAVEAVVGARLLGLSAPTFEVAQALAAKAIARLR